MMTQRATSERLRRIQVDHPNIVYDLSNAFVCCDGDRMDAHTRRHMAVFGDVLMRRRHHSTMTIDTVAGQAIAAPGAGSRMGDSSGPAEFMDDFRPLVLFSRL